MILSNFTSLKFIKMKQIACVLLIGLLTLNIQGQNAKKETPVSPIDTNTCSEFGQHH